MTLFYKKCNKIIITFIIAVLLLSLSNVVLGAGSFSISASSKSLTKGNTTTISVTANNCAGQFSISSSNPSVASVSPSSTWLDNSSATITITAKSAGKATITITAVDVTDTDLNDITGSKTCTVTVTETQTKPPQNNNQGGSSSGGSSSSSNSSSGSTTNKKPTNTTTTTKPNKQEETTEEEKSKDSSLATLAVAEGVLTPEFNKDVKEYKLTVPNEVTTVNVAATTTDKKANYVVTGNAELKEGENIVTITVKAEDGSTTDYVIKVTRARPALSLKSLTIKYTNQNGELIEIPLIPAFSFDVYNYKIEDLEYWVEKLDIQAIANIEGATIDIQGNSELKTGENIITITAKIPVTIEGDVATGEEIKESEEIITYTIKVNKKEEPVPPTLMGRISNWFNGTLSGISAWYTQNQTKVIMVALALCIVALIGLSIYIIVDYKKYKVLLDKLKKVNEVNNSQVVEEIEVQNIAEAEVNLENTEKEDNKDNKPKGGKHF